jgi:hypothetical protein
VLKVDERTLRLSQHGAEEELSPAACSIIEHFSLVAALKSLELAHGHLEFWSRECRLEIVASDSARALWNSTDEDVEMLLSLVSNSYELLFEIVKKTSELPQSGKVFGARPIGIEMHDVVSNPTDALQLFHKRLAVNLEDELVPALRILKKSNVFSECEIGYIFDVSISVRGITDSSQFRGRIFVSNEISNVILDLAEQKKRFSQLCELKA